MLQAENPQQTYEERRLMYVAMTRAKERLLMSYIMQGPDNQPQVSRPGTD